MRMHRREAFDDVDDGVTASPRVLGASSAGAIFSATGERYVTMAHNAASGLRRHSPNLPITLFTDRDVDSDLFDQVVRLANPWRRSKIDAMLASPFERTLYLDADVFVLADMTEALGLLERFDIALAHDQERNSAHGAAAWRRPFDAAFPQFNSGVIVFRRTPEVTGLLRAWRDAVRDSEMERDQPALRELLWESDLRIATLPPEFNTMDLSAIMRLNGGSTAPRIVHHYRIHQTAQGGVPGTLREMLGPATDEAVAHMLAADRYIAVAQTREPRRLPRWRKRALQLRMLLHRLFSRRGRC